jgi:hypothetical protein
MSSVLKSGRLNLLEPSGPVQASNGIYFTEQKPLLKTLKKKTILKDLDVDGRVN